jgi:hypothetical protein
MGGGKAHRQRYHGYSPAAGLSPFHLRVGFLGWHSRMDKDYKVKLEIFEGPLDLLLYLIKKDEIDIYDIPIERITRQYLEYLDAFKILDLDIAGDFVVMAANLIYISSRRTKRRKKTIPGGSWCGS